LIFSDMISFTAMRVERPFDLGRKAFLFTFPMDVIIFLENVALDDNPFLFFLQ